jgi:hypothetical protein
MSAQKTKRVRAPKDPNAPKVPRSKRPKSETQKLASAIVTIGKLAKRIERRDDIRQKAIEKLDVRLEKKFSAAELELEAAKALAKSLLASTNLGDLL